MHFVNLAVCVTIPVGECSGPWQLDITEFLGRSEKKINEYGVVSVIEYD